MTKRILLAIALLLLLHNTAYAYDWTQDANCQGAWLFTEGSGTTVADSSTNSNTGNFASSGHPVWASMAGTGAPSYSTYMADFDGTTNDYISMGDVTVLDGAAAMTSVVWVDPDAFGGIPLAKWINGVFITLLGADGEVFHGVRGANNKYYARDTDDAVITLAGGWYHIGWAWATTQTLTCYVNGVDAGSNSAGLDGTPNTIKNDPDILYFSSVNAPYEGKLTEGALFDDVKDSTDINDIMDNGLFEAVSTRRIWFID